MVFVLSRPVVVPIQAQIRRSTAAVAKFGRISYCVEEAIRKLLDGPA